jgi:hypothetical protein
MKEKEQEEEEHAATARTLDSYFINNKTAES